jgi:hypothetical protein
MYTAVSLATRPPTAPGTARRSRRGCRRGLLSISNAKLRHQTTATAINSNPMSRLAAPSHSADPS